MAGAIVCTLVLMLPGYLMVPLEYRSAVLRWNTRLVLAVPSAVGPVLTLF